MKNFACCLVNISRGEVTLNDIYFVQGESMQLVIDDQMCEYQCDDGDMRFLNGFYFGEENCVLVFDENSKWFELLKTSETWSDETYDEFVDFVYGEQATYA